MNPYSCTLYNCKSLRKLQGHLGLQKKSKFQSLSIKLKDQPLNFYKSFKDKKGRKLFICSRIITSLHKQLMKLFNVEKPQYLKSGVKKESHITNAKYHSASNFFLLIDIKSFYPSITKGKIKKQLTSTYSQSNQVAEFISNLVTVPQENTVNKRALVTGSPLSQSFAYLINKKMLDELNSVSKKENIKFTVYVDDMTFSSKQVISYKFHTKIYNILTKYGYATHLKGEKKNFRGKVGKKSKITGIQITKYGFRLLKKHKDKIKQIIEKNEHISRQKTLLGLVNFAIQVNPKYKKYKSLLKKHGKIQQNRVKNVPS